MNLFDLSGQVAVITGSSRGIGRAIALRMAQQGAKVVVSSRKAEPCQSVVDTITSEGGDAFATTCNIGKRDELQALIDTTLTRWGRIDALVCNAAVNPYYGSALDITDDAYDRVMNCNVRSNFWLSNMVIPTMVKQGGGTITIISSIGGLQGSHKLAVYGLSKAADMQMARNIAVEFGPKNVRANCIAPGLIKTDFARAIWENPDDTFTRSLARIPLQRIGDADEIAGAAVFLAAPAGRFMTGQTLIIDGGGLSGMADG